MNLKTYVEEQGIQYIQISNETGIGQNRLNRLRQGYQPTADELQKMLFVTEGECGEFRDDILQCYKRRRFQV